MSEPAEIKKLIGPDLSEEDIDRVMNMGALGWRPEDMARALGVPEQPFLAEYNNPNSRIALTVARGQLNKAYAAEVALLNAAVVGTVPAITQLYKIQRDRSFEMSKLDIFGGFEDEQAYQRVMDYIDSGSSGALSTKEEIYIDLLNLIYSLSKQHDRRNVIRFLTKAPFKMSYARAVDAYDEAVNLFYSNRNVSREALRQKYAADLDSWAYMIAKEAKSAADYAVAGDLKTKAAKILRLDQPDQEQLPMSQYIKPFRLHSLNPSDVGFEPVNRNDLLPLIEKFVGPEAVKRRLRMEAGIEDVDFIEIVTNVAQEED